jgi:hypothetical protein
MRRYWPRHALSRLGDKLPVNFRGLERPRDVYDSKFEVRVTPGQQNRVLIVEGDTPDITLIGCVRNYPWQASGQDFCALGGIRTPNLLIRRRIVVIPSRPGQLQHGAISLQI